jgi:tRNA (adenine22-N1)-methyltransferase
LNIKLSKRLSFILKLVPSVGDVFYDLCCDHGHLGISVAKIHSYKKVFLIDQVKSIIDKISHDYLSEINLNSPIIDIQCLDARKLKIDQDLKNIISIAGVGGELAIKMVDNLLGQMGFDDILVISAHNNVSKLRSYLIEKKLELLEEGLIEDNKKFYEVLVVRKSMLSKSNISIILNFDNLQSEKIDIMNYYNQQISYLKTKIQYSDDSSFEGTLNAYIASKMKLNSLQFNL